MRNLVIAGTVLALAALLADAGGRAEAMAARPDQLAGLAYRHAGPRSTRVTCRCSRNFPPRRYWRWDHRPVWDDPWAVLRPNFWGSPEPYLVPADRWARKWHPPGHWSWRRRHRPHRHRQAP